MGAVFMADHVYDTIADFAGEAAIGHGYTYSAHPVSAAVGLEVLKLYEGGLLENGRRAGQRLMAGLEGLRNHPLVGDVRGRGMLAAIELVTDKDKKTPLPAAAAPREKFSTAPGKTASSYAPSRTASSVMRRRSAAPMAKSTPSSSGR